ncbi:MAG: ATPase [Eubacterium sp.]|nr:ATPase [Eubacterium sp.]
MARMEQIIEEIEEYIAECKAQPFSQSNIIVNRDEIEEMLEELKTKTPEEIKRYQKIINNKEAILASAQEKADQIIAEAQIQTNELISEHQIMQQAYARANEVIVAATNNAREILDSATNEANDVRQAAMEYTDNLLKSIEDLLSHTIDTSKNRFDGLMKSLQGTLDVVSSNRMQLSPPEETIEEAPKVEPIGEAAQKQEASDEIIPEEIANDLQE